MKLKRDSSLLIAVPAALVIGGALWIGIRGAPDDHAPVRFVLGEAADDVARGGAQPSTTSAVVDAGDAIAVLPAATATTSSGGSVWAATVRARDGGAIENAIVRIRASRNLRLGDDTRIDGGTWVTLKTGADGRVAYGIEPGLHYEIEVRANGFGLDRVFLRELGTSDILLDRSVTAEGRVVTPSGAPIAGATVRYENSVEEFEILTDASGRFRFDDVAVRTARVSVSGTGFVAISRPFVHLPVVEGRALLGDLVVAEGLPLVGEVAGLTGEPLPGASIALLDRMTRQVVAECATGAEGRFAVHALASGGSYFLTAWGPGYRVDVPVTGETATAGLDVRVVPTWTLALVIRDAANAPAAGAHVYLRREDGMPMADGGVAAIRGEATADGVAAFDGLSRSLAYQVVVAKPGYAAIDLGPLSAATHADAPVAVTLVAARAVSGLVVDESGRPVGGVMVRAQRADGFPGPPLFSPTNVNGRFAFDALIAPGRLSLVTFKSGFDNARIVADVPAGAGEFTVPLTIRSLNATLAIVR